MAEATREAIMHSKADKALNSSTPRQSAHRVPELIEDSFKDQRNPLNQAPIGLERRLSFDKSWTKMANERLAEINHKQVNAEDNRSTLLLLLPLLLVSVVHVVCMDLEGRFGDGGCVAGWRCLRPGP
jgi:hypothetical protein